MFADSSGNTVHMGERDCSIQRRHQKVFEESPSPVLTPALRERMGAAAISAAQAIAYEGAGTVEFLYEDTADFYFLEMNTRLQVEHAVTEMLTGIDLVEWQIAIAQGKPLPLTQAEIGFRGHAIEARLCAEAPAQAFQPQTGAIAIWSPAQGADVRIDAGIVAGTTVSPYYDSLLAKIIGHGATREAACRTLLGALQETQIFGVQTNRNFLIECLRQPLFVNGLATTAFIAEAFGPSGYTQATLDDGVVSIAAVLLFRAGRRNWPPTLTGFSSSHPIETPMAVVVDERDPVNLTITQLGHDHYRVSIAQMSKTLRVEDAQASRIRIDCDGVREHVFVAGDEHNIYIDYADVNVSARDALLAPPAAGEASGSGQIRAPMDGVIVTVSVKPEAHVKRGDLLLILEAMKMHHRIVADVDGIVTRVNALAGEQIAMKQLLVEIDQPQVG